MLALVYGLGLFFFYFKYVPQVRLFQYIFLPLLLSVLVLTITSLRWGTLCFVFLFPLINSLPYFFGIYEHTPHAPTALVLFLFFFLGWLIHNLLSPQKFDFRVPLYKPLFIFSSLVVFSAIITFFRYANFWPFLSEHIYELLTNVHGVTAGGAIMSTLFFSLNYLTGLAFFFILLQSVKSKQFIRRLLLVLLTSTGFSLLVGLYQNFIDLSFGNTPLRTKEGILNATFKDPLSLGAYLSLFLPLLLAGMFFCKRTLRVVSGFLFLLGLFFILPRTGSKSGLLGSLISIVLFGAIFLIWGVERRKLKTVLSSHPGVTGGISLLIMACLFSGWMLIQDSEAYKRLTLKDYKYGSLQQTLSMRKNQWLMASYMMEDFPLTGVGVGAYIIELPNYIKTHKGKYKQWTDSAENYFFQAGAEMGVVAVFLGLWIFWEILKQIKKTLKQHLSSERWKYMQIGICCGVVSLLLNFLVHTYIGSYEIKYMFWLMVALLFAQSKIFNPKHYQKTNFSKPFKLSCLGLLVVFSGLHLWNSTHSLSLNQRTQKLGINQNFGFYKKETTEQGKEFRWTQKYGGMTIHLKRPVLKLSLLASHPDIDKNPVRVKIYLVKDLFREKKLLEEVVLERSVWETYEFSVAEEVGGKYILFFEVSRTWNPLRSTGAPDPRNLGVAVGEIQHKIEPKRKIKN